MASTCALQCAALYPPLASGTNELHDYAASAVPLGESLQLVSDMSAFKRSCELYASPSGCSAAVALFTAGGTAVPVLEGTSSVCPAGLTAAAGSVQLQGRGDINSHN